MVTFSQYQDGNELHPEEPQHELWTAGDGRTMYAAVNGYRGNRSYPDNTALLKTHWPKDYGGIGHLTPNNSSRIICLHRFPMDAMASFIRYRSGILERTVEMHFSLTQLRGGWEFLI